MTQALYFSATSSREGDEILWHSDYAVVNNGLGGITGTTSPSFSLGPLDIPNNVFPTIVEAEEYYFTFVEATLLAAINIFWGSTEFHSEGLIRNTTQNFEEVNDKVDKVTGKGLSTEDYTTAEKTKLSGIATGATNTAAPVNADWSSGSGLSQILNKPTIPTI